MRVVPASHSPVEGLHRLVVQSLPVAPQTTMVSSSTTQAPAVQTRVPLQGSPSSNVLQSSSASHAQSGFSVPTQVPSVHMSSRVQRSPSLHSVPLSTGVFWTPAAGSQLSAVHSLPSSGSSMSPAQAPDLQRSSMVHASASSQDVPFSAFFVLHSPLPGSQ